MNLRLLLLLVLAAYAAPGFAQGVLGELVVSGPRDRRVNIVFLSEGYTAAQLAAFPADAARILEDLLSTPPYAGYRGYFNAFTISVASNESGSDHPSRNAYRDTYFNTYYDCSGIQRLICLGGNGSSRAQTLLQQHVPEYDIVLVVVNDTEYGGSGGAFAVTSVNSAASEIAIHEVGHSFGRLADEYGGGTPLAGREGLNATRETRREHIKWRHWILDATPLPTPFATEYRDVVGLFEGAVYNDTGWFRPQYACKMRSLGVPFCAVCTEHHIAAVYNLVGPIDAAEPPAGPLALTPGEARTLRVTPMAPQRHALEVVWRVDGVPVDGATGPAYTVHADALPSKPVVISARVSDPQAAVRNPALLPLLADSVSWTVSRSGATAVEDPAPPAFSLDGHYPNPVRGATTFHFRLPAPGPATLAVYDVQGRRVATVAAGARAGGIHRVSWSAADLAPGLYLYRLEAGGQQATRRMVVVH